MATIGNDVVLQLALGERYDGSTPSFNALGDFSGRARRLSAGEDSKMTDTKALGDDEEQNVPHGLSRNLQIDALVPQSGSNFRTGSDPVVGRWIQVTTKPHTNTVASQTWEGVVQKWDWDVDEGKEQIEKIMINCSMARN